MSDTHQAIYDAVRSRLFGSGNIDDAIKAAVREVLGDVSFHITNIADSFHTSALEPQRPSAVFRPRLYPDGDQWCALYGDDLQSGVAGFGDTPDQAMRDFDAAWATPLSAQRTQAAQGGE